MKKTSTFLVTCPHCATIKRITFSKILWREVDSIMWPYGRIESTE